MGLFSAVIRIESYSNSLLVILLILLLIVMKIMHKILIVLKTGFFTVQDYVWDFFFFYLTVALSFIFLSLFDVLKIIWAAKV